MSNYQPPPPPDQQPPQGPQPGWYPPYQQPAPPPGSYPLGPPQLHRVYATPQGTPYVIPPKPFNHGVHLIVTFCTFGLWLPFYLLIWALHPRKATIVYPDGRREKR